MRLFLHSRLLSQRIGLLHGPPAHHRSRIHANSFKERLKQAEEAGDWGTALEVVTEAKVLKQSLSATEIESASRAYVKGKQYQRAIDLLSRVEAPSESTVLVLFESLAMMGQGQRASELLIKVEFEKEQREDIKSDDPSPSPLSPLYNLTIRAFINDGNLDEAYKLMEKMAMSLGRYSVDPAMFNLLANEFLKAGRQDDGESVLDLRDYF